MHVVPKRTRTTNFGRIVYFCGFSKFVFVLIIYFTVFMYGFCCLQFYCHLAFVVGLKRMPNAAIIITIVENMPRLNQRLLLTLNVSCM